MSETHITACGHGPGIGGPDLPLPWSAMLGRRVWTGVGTVTVLRLLLGRDTVEVWPCTAEQCRKLAADLERVAQELEG